MTRSAHDPSAVLATACLLRARTQALLCAVQEVLPWLASLALVAEQELAQLPLVAEQGLAQVILPAGQELAQVAVQARQQKASLAEWQPVVAGSL